MYSVLNYGYMAADGVRMDAYSRALERLVKPGSIVLDIGAGTGIFSLLAARAGAARVHAVEPNPAIWVLAELARENGLADRITIHHATSYDLDLTEKADVIVSDLRGSLPVHEEHFAVLRDAKARLLAPSGVLLPARDDLYVSLFESDEIVGSLHRGAIGFEQRGWSAKAIRRSIFNMPTSDSGKLRSNDLVTTSACWSSITYGAPAQPLEGTVELLPRRRGTAHGLAVWFAATIYDDLGFATEPGTTMVYSRFVLPLLEPIAIDHDDRISVVLRVDEHGQRWAWDTKVTTNGQPKARFRQSSFFGAPTSPEALLRGSSSFKPHRSKRGDRVKDALALMDGSRTVAEIAKELPASLSSSHSPESATLEEVRDLVARYGR
ncbi:MAG TPA: 50S ribosomal protein L11 methyltransferase [Labilithrix sp.]|jgi:protein arginine N-methyltransferase 1|nr:50S ribosomal protein L11 methyltransferase [Labilithrix sp.]